MSESTTVKSVKSKRPASKSKSKHHNNVKRPQQGAFGACGGRGARTVAIENFIAKSKNGASVRDIEDSLAPEVKAISNHVRTLYAVKNLLRREIRKTDGAYVYFIASRKSAKKNVASKSKSK